MDVPKREPISFFARCTLPGRRHFNGRIWTLADFRWLGSALYSVALLPTLAIPEEIDHLVPAFSLMTRAVRSALVYTSMLAVIAYFLQNVIEEVLPSCAVSPADSDQPLAGGCQQLGRVGVQLGEPDNPAADRCRRGPFLSSAKRSCLHFQPSCLKSPPKRVRVCLSALFFCSLAWRCLAGDGRPRDSQIGSRDEALPACPRSRGSVASALNSQYREIKKNKK